MSRAAQEKRDVTRIIEWIDEVRPTITLEVMPTGQDILDALRWAKRKKYHWHIDEGLSESGLVRLVLAYWVSGESQLDTEEAIDEWIDDFEVDENGDPLY